MATESGRKIAVGIGRETTRGTAVAPAYWIKHLDLDLNPVAEKVWNESGIGVLDKLNSADVVKDITRGGFGGKVTDRSFPLLLMAAAGQVSTPTANADGTTTHAITQSQNNDSMALTLALKDGNRDQRFPLGMLRSLELNIAAGEWVKFAASLVARKATEAAGNTVAYITENEFKAKHVTIKVAANVAGLAGATAVPVREANLTFDRATEEYMAVGSNDPHGIHAKELEVSGDMTLLYSDNAYRDLDLNNTYQAVQIELTNNDVTIGTGSARPSIVITMPRVALAAWEPDQGLGNMIEQSFDIKALYSQANGHTWTGSVTNTVAGY